MSTHIRPPMTLRLYLHAERGRAARLAEALRVPATLISLWARESRQVPAGRCLPIEWYTRGAVRAETLRPDLSFKRHPRR